MKRLRARDLVLPFLLVGLIAYALLRANYDSIPPLNYGIAVPLGALALLEFVAGRRVRAAVNHHPEAKLMEAIVIARCVALGRASSLVGAGLVGASVAVLVRVIPTAGTVRAAAADLQVALVIAAVSIALTVAGLLLEHAGIDPGSRGGQPIGNRRET